MQQPRRNRSCEQRGDTGSGFDNKNKAEERKKERKCDVRFSIVRRNLVFQKTCMRIGVRKLSRMGWSLRECGEDKPLAYLAYRKVEVEASDVGRSRQAVVSFFVSFLGGD